MDELNWPLMLGAGMLASASPGPATLGIAGTSMQNGRGSGLLLASGVIAGSYVWSITAAFGVGALLLANIWVLETVRFLGAAYLIWLAFKSFRAALRSSALSVAEPAIAPRGFFLAGLFLHLTNPKPVLFFGTLFSIGVPYDTTGLELALVVLIVGLNNATVFLLYAMIFSDARVTDLYRRARRWFEIVFAVLFGAVGIRILAMKIE